MRQSSLTAVLVPTTRAELSALFTLFFVWGGYARLNTGAPALQHGSCKLIVTLDCERDEKIEAGIRSGFDQFGLSALFSSVEIGFCSIPTDENIYVRHGEKHPTAIPKLGLKSGPNTQFFSSLIDFCGNEDVVLLNEVDCFPTTKDWLARLSRLVSGSEPFWILGSPYRGYGRLGPEIVAHINGNALYGVGTEGFREVLVKQWLDGLAGAISGRPDLAYDVFLDYAHHDIKNPRTWKAVPLEKVRFYSELLCKVRHTDLIHNLAGTVELTGLVKIDLTDYLTAHPAAALVHGRFLSEQVLGMLMDQLSVTPDHRSWLARASSVLSNPPESGFRDTRVHPASSRNDRGSVHRYFAFSLHKAGSTLFYSLLRGATRRSQTGSSSRSLNYVSVPDQLSNAGIPGRVLLEPDFKPDSPHDAVNTVYGGFRFVPGYIDDTHLKDAGVMILVRDPRDLLTSLYFSILKSHRVPPGLAGEEMLQERETARTMNIDEFVLDRARNQDWVQRFDRITSLRDAGKAWRYEDVVFKKAAWLDEILDYLGLDLPVPARKALVERVDVFPDSDRPDDHVRQVTPGDHRRKLRPETIEELNTIFAKPLANWGYAI